MARGNRSQLRSAKRAAMYYKTRMCPSMVLGSCPEGCDCPFAHDEAEMRAKPDLSCTKLCPTWVRGEVCDNPRCKHAHDVLQLRTPVYPKCFVRLTKKQLRGGDATSQSSEDDEDGWSYDSRQETDLLPTKSFGPDHVVVLQNTFISVRPKAKPDATSRRAKSTPPGL
mmetsp:Transcript_8060/g.14500  ORF Transcript_8060/g.14500 Transcript_8060/m.14500 type:complete len:168 (-) Transcript_8060:88-591(-)